jgi:hypothetical protein
MNSNELLTENVKLRELLAENIKLREGRNITTFWMYVLLQK